MAIPSWREHGSAISFMVMGPELHIAAGACVCLVRGGLLADEVPIILRPPAMDSVCHVLRRMGLAGNRPELADS